MAKRKSAIEKLEEKISKKRERLGNIENDSKRAYGKLHTKVRDELYELQDELHKKEYQSEERAYQKSGIIQLTMSEDLGGLIELDHLGHEKLRRRKPVRYFGRKIISYTNVEDTSREKMVKLCKKENADGYLIKYESRSWKEKPSIHQFINQWTDSGAAINRGYDEQSRAPLEDRSESWKDIDLYRRSKK